MMDVKNSRNSRLSHVSRRYSQVGRPTALLKRGSVKFQDIDEEDLEPFRRARGAKLIQSAFRRTKLMYQIFGPMLFCRKDGVPADFGRISFTGAKQGHSASHFITVSDSTSIDLISNFIAFYWKLHRPEVLISITGGARDFDLTPQLHRVLGQGLVDAVRVSKAWLITGGTDTGVMKLVGDVIHKHSVKLPLIGIVAHGCVNDRALLHGSQGGNVQYPKSQSSGLGSPLNMNHNYFILVDNGVEAPAAWGGEIPFRSKFEALYRVNKHVPSVLLVVQGGVGTLSTILTAARVGTPIVLLAESGGAATAVYHYILRDGEIDDGFESHKEALAELLTLQHASDAQLLLFVLSDGENADLSTALLQAIVNTFKSRDASSRTTSVLNNSGWLPSIDSMSSLPATSKNRDGLAGALQLSIQWDRFDVFLTIIEQMEQLGKEYAGSNRSARRLSLSRALQRALELQRTRMVRYLLSMPDCKLEGLHLARLYTVEDKYSFLRSDFGLIGRINESMHLIFDEKNGSSVQLYHSVVRPLFYSLSPLLGMMMCSSAQPQMRDLFLWATIMGDRALALELWARCLHPLRMALLASSACSQAADRINWGRDDMMDLAEELEGWAIGVLEAVPQPNVAHHILSREIPGVSPHTVTNIGLHLQKKAFISHRYVQSQLDLIWRGDESAGTGVREAEREVVPEDFSYFLLALRSFLPGFVAHLGRALKTEDDESLSVDEYGFKRDENISQSMIFEAMAKTLKIARAERTSSFRAQVDASKAEGKFEAIETVARDVCQRFQYGNNAQEDRPQPSKEKRSHGFYQIPVVKFTIRGSLHVVQLLLYARVLGATLTPEQLEMVSIEVSLILSPFELAFFFLTIGLALDELHQWRRRHKLQLQQLQHGFDKILHLSDVAILCAVTMRIASITLPLEQHHLHRNLYISYQLVLSFNVIFCSLRLVPYLSVKKQFGVLVIIVEEMFDDLAQFLRLFIIVVVAFSLAVTGLSEGDVQAWSDGSAWGAGYFYTAESNDVGDLSPNATGSRALHSVGDSPVQPRPDLQWYESDSAFMLPLWCVFGAVDIDVIEERLPVFSLLMAFYMLIASVVMVNLLVAMFSETYSRIKTRAELEYLFEKSVRIHHYMLVSHRFAPILNAPFVLCELLGDLCVFCLTKYNVHETEEYESEEKLVEEHNNETEVNDSTYYVDRFLKVKQLAEDGKIDTLTRSTHNSVAQLSKDVNEHMQSTKGQLSELATHLSALSERLDKLQTARAEEQVDARPPSPSRFAVPDAGKETPGQKPQPNSGAAASTATRHPHSMTKESRQDTLAREADRIALEAVASLQRACRGLPLSEAGDSFETQSDRGADAAVNELGSDVRTPDTSKPGAPLDSANDGDVDSIKKRIAQLQEVAERINQSSFMRVFFEPGSNQPIPE